MFDFLQLIRPHLGKPSARAAQVRTRVELRKHLALPMPLFVHDLPWSERTPELARHVADSLDALGIAVTGLQSEFYQTTDESNPDTTDVPIRICPYRPERYGMQLDDLQHAQIIEVRLSGQRDALGLPRYPASAMRRWDRRAARMADRAVERFGSMESLVWPPDVENLEKLPGKVDQLRLLAPQALISVSIEATRVAFDLPAILRSNPDIVTLCAEHWPGSQAKTLVEVILRTLRVLDAHDEARNKRSQGLPPPETHLAVVPPRGATELDVVKLLALGVKLVAIDPWCGPLMVPDQHRLSSAEWAAANLGVITAAADKEDKIDLAPLHMQINRLLAWCESVGVAHIQNLDRTHLASFLDELAGIRSVVTGVTTTEQYRE